MFLPGNELLLRKESEREELKRLDWKFLGLQNKTTHRAFLNTYSWALLQESVTGFGGMWTYIDQRGPCLLQWQVYKRATKKHFSVLSRFFFVINVLIIKPKKL